MQASMQFLRRTAGVGLGLGWVGGCLCVRVWVVVVVEEGGVTY